MPKVVPQDPDADLVRLAKAGEYDAFEQLVQRHERRVYTLALRILRLHEDAEEVVQETFVSVIEHLKGFEGQSKFVTWLIRIATNNALKLLARRNRRTAVSLDAPADGDGDREPLPHPQYVAQWSVDPSDVAERHEVRELLAEALDQIDEKYRVVFLLRDVEGLSTEETAAATGLTISNVKVRLLRARLMLRERLTRTLGDPSTQVSPAHEHDG